MNQTQTPRTDAIDALAERKTHLNVESTYRELARTLERENAALRAALAESERNLAIGIKIQAALAGGAS